MAGTVAPPEPPPTDDTAATDDPVERQGRGPLATAFRYLAMPLLITVILGALYLWVSGQDLDSIEMRELSSGVLIAQTLRHIQLSALSTFFVLLLAVPTGILVTRPRYRRLAPAVIGLGNAGQAIPSLGALALLYFLFNALDVPLVPSTGLVPVTIGLVGYSFLPILRNTMVGLSQVDDSVMEAGKGMGLSERTILRRIELPLAVPVVLAGVRTALVLNVGTAALAVLFGGGGLGQVILVGFQLSRTPILITGAVLVAALALAADYLAGIVEERLTPKGL
jgi:osmoprotectant transport system permease protein